MSAPIQEDLLTKCNRALARGEVLLATDIASRESILCEQAGDLKQAGIWRCSLAQTLNRQGRYPEAAKEAGRSVDIQPDHYQRALALHVLATSQLLYSKSTPALINLGKAEEVGGSLGQDPYLRARWSGAAALAFCLTGDLDRAIAEWMAAASLFRRAGHYRDAAVALNSIGFELAKHGHASNAENVLRTSLELLAKEPHLPVKAAICDSVGYLYTITDRSSEAERYLNESARIFQMIPDKPQLVGTLLHLSELHERLHDLRVARSEAERALKLAGETGLEHLCTDARTRLSSIEALSPSNVVGSRCFHGLVYASHGMQSVIARLKIIAATDEVVLVLGETGTGKELVAQAVHEESRRRTGPFIPFNCSALSRELVESRLFGHRKGAFTGAYSDEQGLIRAAAGGSVFLDEIGDLSREAQGALLRFLQSREVQPIGATRPIHTDVRVIAATNRDLRTEVEEGRFRRDLYYRLSAATLFVPPLWQRPEDVKELARHFGLAYSKQEDKPEPIFSGDEIQRLVEYKWPGNVRELENYVKRRVLFGDVGIEGDGSRNDPGAHRVHPFSVMRPGSGNGIVWRNLSASEKYDLLVDALESNRRNVSSAARELGISRRTIQRLKRKEGSKKA